MRRFAGLGRWLTAAAALVAAAVAPGYDLIKDDSNIYIVSWDPGPISMRVMLAQSPALSEDASQSSAVVEAMNAWNARLGTVQFVPVVLPANPNRAANGINEIVLSNTISGEAFDESTLAVTLSRRLGNSRTEADIVFNSAWNWDSYRGPLRSGNNEDMRRVAIHELGHVLGLDHPDQASPPQFVSAIMNSRVSNTDSLQNDDIAGAQSMYGSPGFVPGNNDFANAYTINLSSGSTSVTGTNVAATSEGGEPALDNDDPGRKTVWWRWTAPTNGEVTATTLGSNFDTLLGVYTGGSVGGLAQIALNDDVESGVIRTSTVSFAASAGTSYSFAVDGWGGYAGAVRLNLSFTPPAQPPVIVSQPSNASTTDGFSVNFYMAATSNSGGVAYQWQRLAVGTQSWVNVSNDAIFSGATGSHLTVRAVLAMSGDRFRCVASNAAGSVTSSEATLVVSPQLPSIDYIGSKQVAVGGTVVFEPVVRGNGPFTYQWSLNGVDISGATQASFTVVGATEAKAGAYGLRVTSPYGSTSSSFSLTVVYPPVIQTQPSDITVATGYSFSLSVGFSWTSGTTVQWSRNGVPLPYGTSSYYNVSNASPADAGSYTVKISNVAGEVVSRTVTVVVLPRPAPENVTISSDYSYNNPSGISLYVNIRSEWGAPLSYQWYLNGEPIVGATQSRYAVAIPTAAQYGDYFVTVTAPGGTGVSNTLAIQWNPPSTPVQGAWLQAWEVDGVVYFLHATTPRIARYDLATQSWLSAWTLPQVPVAFDFTADALYVAYNADVVKYARDFSSAFTLASVAAPIKAMTVAGNYLVVVSNPSYYDWQFRSLDRHSGLVVANKSGSHFPSRGLVYSAAAQKLFARNTGSSPSDLYTIGFGADGTFGQFLSSPYHGDYPEGSRLQVSADGQVLFENSGVAYATTDLTVSSTMGGRYQDMLQQADGTFLVLRGGRLILLDAKFQEKAAGAFSGFAEKVARHNDTLFGFTPALLAGQNPGVEILPMSSLQEPAMPPALDAAGRAVWGASYFIDEAGVVYFYGKTDRNVYRWSSLEDRYLPSLPMRYAADRLVFQPRSHSFFYAHRGTNIRRLTMGGGASDDTSFYATPQPILGMQSVGEHLMFVDETGAWVSHSTISLDAKRADWEEWNYYSREYVWNEATRRLYFFRDDSSPNDILYETIDLLGRVGSRFDSPYHGDVRADLPIRVASDGSRVILGSGQVYDGSTLKLQGTLSVQPKDALAFGDSIYVAQLTEAGTEVYRFAADTLSLVRRQSYPGTLQRLLEAPGQQLMLVTSSGGVPRFRLLSSGDLSEIVAAGFSGPPVIIAQPRTVGTATGMPAVFSVAAKGAASLRFQWQKDGEDIPGATNATFVIPAISSTDVGNYRAVVTNDAGSVTSVAAPLLEIKAPVITKQPVGALGLVGQPAEFTVEVADASAVSYQWYRDSYQIPGATGATYRIPAVERYNSAARYQVEISNQLGSVRSVQVSLSVVEPPTITAGSSDKALYVGEALTLTIGFSATPAPTIQWYLNGEPIEGATSYYYSRPSALVEDSGQYTAVISNDYGSVTTQPITVRVSNIPGGALLSASDAHSLILTGDGVVWGQGDGSTYALGSYSNAVQAAPILVTKGAVSALAGNGLSLVIRSDGSVWARGYGAAGKFGAGSGVTYSYEAQIAPSAKALANGTTHLLLLKPDASVWARGNNDNGQIGDGVAGTRSDWTQIGSDTIAIAAGDHTSWFLRANGQLWATGALEYTGLPGSSGGNIRRSPELIAAGVGQVAVGGTVFAFVKQDGSLWTLGRNDLGQLGHGTIASAITAAQVATGVKRVAVSSRFMLFVKEDDSLWGMGDVPFLPESGSAPADRTRPYVLAAGVAQIAAGATHALFSKLDGRVYAGGANGSGQLGDGTTIARTTPVPIWVRTLSAPTGAAVWTTATANVYENLIRLEWSPVIGASEYEIFRARVNDVSAAQLIGRVNAATIFYDRIADAEVGVRFFYWVRSRNSAGAGVFSTVATRLRMQVTAPSITLQPVNARTFLGGSVRFTIVASGEPAPSYRWQRLPAGSTQWEDVSTTQPLTYEGANTPALVLLAYRTLQGNHGDRFRCVVTNLAGSVTSQEATLSVTSTAGAVTSSAGLISSRFIRSDGSMWAMGSNQLGEIGDGTTTRRLSPVKVADQIVNTAMGFDHALLVTADGRLLGSGSNTEGMLGLGDTTSRSVPTLIETNVSHVSAGYRHSLFRKRDGSLWAMGLNGNGQLGDGTTTRRLAPVKIGDSVASIAAGSEHSFFVKFDGTLWVTGNNAFGLFGDGSTASVLSPKQVGIDTVAVATFYHSLFLRKDGTVWGAGLNDRGQLVDGTFVDRSSPVLIASNAVAIAVGARHSVVLKSDGTLWTAGANNRGQLGDGTNVDRGSLVQVASEVATISAGLFQTFFVKTDGSLWATGGNDTGQLGDGSTTDRNAPVQIASGANTLPYYAAFNVVTNSAAADRIKLQWAWPSGASHFELWRASSNDPSTAVRIARMADNYYEDLSAASGVTYSYWVKSFSPAGTLDFGTPVQGRYGATSTPPVIATQPQDQTVTLGSSFIFMVVANEATNYQWHHNDEPISGATAASYSATATADLAGSYTVVVTGPGGSVTSEPATLAVNKLAQTITFAAPADRAYTATPFALSATASSQLPVSFALVSGPATLAGDQLTLTGVGTVTVRATQSGDTTYAAAPGIERSFLVTPASATLTLGNLSATYDGTAKPASATTAPAGLTVTLTYDGLAPAPTNAGSYAVVATFNETNYTGTATGTLVIGKAAQTITFAPLTDQGFTLTPITLSATASSGLPVSFEVVSGSATVNATALTLTGSGPVTVRATQPGDANHEAAPSVERSFTVVGNYESWRLAHFTADELLDSSISGANADPDGDGFANLLEYALGFEPRTATTSGLPEVAATASEWTYTYMRPSDRSDVTYAVEMSTNLTTWTANNVTHELVSTDAATGMQTWRARVPLATGASVFLRLLISKETR